MSFPFCYVLVGFIRDYKFLAVKVISANRMRKFVTIAKVLRKKENTDWYEK